MRPHGSFWTGVFACVLTASVAAHEFWVTSVEWAVAPGDRITLLANVGSVFPAADTFTVPERVAAVRLVGPTTDTAVPPPYRREGDSLAADVAAPSAAGTYVGIFGIKPRTAEKSAAVFEEHLKHQGSRRWPSNARHAANPPKACVNDIPDTARR